MTRRYHVVDDGVPIYPMHNRFDMRCCDCALTHRVRFRVVRRRGRRIIQMTTWRDRRATAAARRANGIRVVRARR